MLEVLAAAFAQEHRWHFPATQAGQHLAAVQKIFERLESAVAGWPAGQAPGLATVGWLALGHTQVLMT